MSQVLELTKKLISSPSTRENFSELKNVLEIAKNELKDFECKEFTSAGIPSLIFYNTALVPDSYKVILNAHLDVVPGQPEQYKAKIKNGKLFGRGACDMKSGAAAEILAFKEVASMVKYPLGLQLVTDEEIGGFLGTKYQIDQGVKAEFVIAGESTNLQLNNKAKGVFWIKISSKGNPAHAAYLWNGKNAIWAMKTFLDRVEQTFPVPTDENWTTTANLAKIETTNTTFNKVPDDCTVSLDIRYIPEDSSTIEKKLRALIPAGFKVEVQSLEPAQFTDSTNPILNKLSESILKVLGHYTGFISKHGASDVRHYDRKKIPGVCFGPIGDGLHSDDEWCDIDSLDKYYQILTDFLLTL
jgi:succinyl-diaminopimelate desuccinylase